MATATTPSPFQMQMVTMATAATTSITSTTKDGDDNCHYLGH